MGLNNQIIEYWGDIRTAGSRHLRKTKNRLLIWDIFPAYPIKSPVWLVSPFYLKRGGPHTVGAVGGGVPTCNVTPLRSGLNVIKLLNIWKRYTDRKVVSKSNCPHLKSIKGGQAQGTSRPPPLGGHCPPLKNLCPLG